MWDSHHYCDSCTMWLPDTAALNNHQLSVHSYTDQHVAASTAYQSLEVRDAVRSITARRPAEEKPAPSVQSNKLYSCDLCARQFSSQEVLQLHKASSHTAPPDQPQFEIQILAPAFKEESNLAAFSCTFCQASCASSAGLDQHTLAEHAALLDLVPQEEEEPGRRTQYTTTTILYLKKSIPVLVSDNQYRYRYRYLEHPRIIHVFLLFLVPLTYIFGNTVNKTFPWESC